MYGCNRRADKHNCTNGIYYTFHNGIDIESPLNSPIYSMYDGEVIETGTSTTLGDYIMIQSNIGGQIVTIQYGHLSELLFNTGDDVTSGTVVAKSGDSGNSRTSGAIPHVHIRAFSGWNLVETNPIGFLGTTFNSVGQKVTPCENN